MPRQMTTELRQISLEALGWLAKFEEPPVSPQDEAEFAAWLSRDPRHKAEYEKAQSSVAMTQTLQLKDFPGYQKTSRLSLWRFYASEAADFFIQRKGLSFGLGGLVAAGIAVTVFVAGPQTPISPAKSTPIVAAYQSGIGERKRVMLSDGSEITLGAKSSIETQFFLDKRLVILTKGVAYFDVAPDPSRPFTVKTADLTAMAVGTAFDVRNNGDTFRVGVTEGQVEVGYPLVVDGKTMGLTTKRALKAGQVVAANTQNGLNEAVETNSKFIAAWRSSQLVYQNVSLAELVVDLNRYSLTPIRIDAASPNLRLLKFGGVFPDQNIDSVLNMVADVHAIWIDKSNPQETILRRK